MSAPPLYAFDRKRALAKIHIARKALGLDEESYRAVLTRAAGVPSAREASDAGLGRVLAEMRRLGFRDGGRYSAKPEIRKVKALWKALAPLLEEPSEQALASFCRRMTGVAHPEWMNAREANKVIEALKAWRAREEGKMGDAPRA